MKDSGYLGYSKARDASWKVITEHNICTLPVDVFELAHKMGIKVVSYRRGRFLMTLLGVASLRDSNDGLYVRFLNGKFIFYDDSVTSEGRIRFTIAHEIGHHVLGHIKEGVLLRPKCAERSKGKYSGSAEKEANVFASRLLAPSGVLHRMKVTTAEEISALCGISREAAEYRANRLVQLTQRNMFNVSKLEQKAMSNFNDFINKWQ